jgi:uncharacterized protein with HEPN domain
MDSEVQSYLWDIIKAIEEIETFFEGKPKLFAEFQKDIKTKRAVERNLEIVGEAINRIKRADNTISITNADKIIATRNRLAHAYDNVSDEVIWSIVIKHLSPLKEEIQHLLK